MSKTNLLIIEDEPLILEDLEETLRELGYAVLETATNVNDSLNILKKMRPDLLLIDIDLEGELDGIDLAHEVNNHYQIPFIFLTAFYDQATLLRSRSTSPSGYIVKPWSESTLKANIEMALYKRKISEHATNNTPESFYVKQKNEYLSIKPNQIVFAQSYDNYTYIFTDNDKFLISHTLKSVEEKLSPFGFVRVHKSYLVNLGKIESIADGRLSIGEQEIPLGRVYKKELLKHLHIL